VLKLPGLDGIGFGFAKQALALPKNPKHYRQGLDAHLLQAELRRSGQTAAAQAIALAEIERVDTGPEKLAEYAAFVPNPAKRAALVELAGIYDAAGRSEDVLRLLNEVGAWSARDLLAIIALKDSLGTPLGLMAAKALAASGDHDTAKTTVRVLLDRMPGYDPAYQLLVDLNGEQAVEELDRLYTLDQFQERPLIWKAVALNKSGQFDEAERTIRRAIAIDPSDGEQGQNDRMRAYAVLADTLEAKGDTTSAQENRRAVSAIRLSEQADELHKLGLYQRAFAGYRAALDEFSDTYCIQSRLAVQLASQGLHDEAIKHYRRAYELMPDSFGKVESHCFGCESVFANSSAQDIAEQVFTDLIKRSPTSPQAHYMLGYLRKEQGHYDEAVKLFRQAVALDGDYLNAWKHLHQLGEKIYIEPSERDIARLKLFDLDPRQRHVTYSLDEVTNFTTLWQAYSQVAANRELNLKVDQVYPLAASAREHDNALAKLPPGMRSNMESYADLMQKMGDSAGKLNLNTASTVANHELINEVLALMGEKPRHGMYD
jgi:tetratricopeptide (TPR) repeat protein